MAVLRGDEILRRTRFAAARALNRAAAEILVEALPRTPMDEGDLRATGHREEASIERLRAEVSFGGQSRTGRDVVYAAAQHEGVMFYERDGQVIHWEAKRYTTPGTGPKYLEGPFLEAIPGLENTFANELRRIF